MDIVKPTDIRDSARDLLGALNISHDTASVEVGKNNNTNLIIVKLSGSDHEGDAKKLENVVGGNQLAKNGSGVQIGKYENPEDTTVVISSIKGLETFNEIIKSSKKSKFAEMDEAEKLKQSKGDTPNKSVSEEAKYVRQHLDDLVKNKTTGSSSVTHTPEYSMDGSKIEHKFVIETHTHNGKLDNLRSELSKEVEAAGGVVNSTSIMNPHARSGVNITIECNDIKEFAKNLGFKKAVGQESPGTTLSDTEIAKSKEQEHRALAHA